MVKSGWLMARDGLDHGDWENSKTKKRRNILFLENIFYFRFLGQGAQGSSLCEGWGEFIRNLPLLFAEVVSTTRACNFSLTKEQPYHYYQGLPSYLSKIKINFFDK